MLNSSAKEDDISQVQEDKLGGLDFVRTRTGRGAQRRQVALIRSISGLSGKQVKKVDCINHAVNAKGPREIEQR